MFDPLLKPIEVIETDRKPKTASYISYMRVEQKGIFRIFMALISPTGMEWEKPSSLVFDAEAIQAWEC